MSKIGLTAHKMDASAPHKFVIIGGPTASGKSALAMDVAEKFSGEIVSCDSVQIYKGFDIGSAKPTNSEQQKIPHHLIDIKNGDEDYDAAQFAEDARRVMNEIQSRKKLPIVVGGTGLYIRSLIADNFQSQIPHDPELREKLNQLSNEELMNLLQEKDPTRAKQIHINDKFRLARAVEACTLLGKPVSEVFSESKEDVNENSHYFFVYIEPPRDILHQRIAKRSQAMIDMGLVDEVKSLLAKDCSPQSKPMQTIGYAQCIKLIENEISPEELCDKIIFATRQYAKRQCTWFKKSPYQIKINEPKLDLVQDKISEFLGR